MAVTPRASITQRTQIAVETTYGVAAATNFRRLPTLMLTPNPEQEEHEYRTQGNKFPSIVVPNKEWNTSKGDGTISYGEAVYIFASLFGNTTPVAGTGTSSVWTFAPSNGGVDTPASFTMQHGDQNFGTQTLGNVITDLTLDISRAECKASISSIGRAFDNTVALAVLNATQTVTIGGAPTGGSFALTFKGQTATGIAFNAAAAAVQAALVALSTIGTGGVTVTGTGPYVVTFAGALASSAQPTITGSAAGLTGGAPTITITPTAGAGVTLVENIPVQPAQVAVYLDATYAGLGTTKLGGTLSAKFTLSGRWQPIWVVDSGLTSYGGLVEGEPKASVELLLIADAQAYALFTSYRAGTTVYIQVKAIGPAIAGGGTYTLTLNLPVEVAKLQEYKDEGGVYALGFEFRPIADATAGYPMQAAVINATATL